MRGCLCSHQSAVTYGTKLSLPNPIQHRFAAGRFATGKTQKRSISISITRCAQTVSSKPQGVHINGAKQTWPILMDLPKYHPSKDGNNVQLVIAGAGPSGLAVAERVSLVSPEQQ